MRSYNSWKKTVRRKANIEIYPGTTQIIELRYKDIKTVMMSVFCMFKKLERRKDSTSRNKEDIKGPNKRLRMKTKMSELKSTTNGITAD